MTTPSRRAKPNTVLAVAAAAASVLAVGVVVAVTPSAGHDARGAAAAASDTSGATAPSATGSPTDSATDTGSASGIPGGGYSSSNGGSASSSSAGSSSSQGGGVLNRQPTDTDGSAPGSPTGGSKPSPSRSTSQPPATHPTTPRSTTPTPPPPPPTTSPASNAGLDDPAKKEIAMELVSSAENSSLDWRAQYKYIEDIHDGRGYTGGIIGFCSGTGDMLEVVQRYAALEPGNILQKYLGALKADNNSASHSGLDPNFTKDWVTAASDPKFQQAQDDERDAEYFNPAVDQAKADGLGTLGQFIYYDAMVMHGPGSDPQSFGGIRAAALRKAKPPSQGGDQIAFLNAFLDARIVAMKADPSHQDTSRIDTEQRLFVKAGNLNLDTPLHWWTYGDAYTID